MTADPRFHAARGRVSLAFVAVLLQLAVLAYVPAAGQAPAPLLTVGVEVVTAERAQVTYRFTVSNRGSAAAPDVRVSHTVPEHTTFERSDPQPSGAGGATQAPACASGGSPENAGVTCEWAVGEIPSGRSAIVFVTLNVVPSETAFEVASKATATSGGVTAEDTDSSLQRAVVDVARDAWVRDADAPGTNHGACDYLLIDQSGRASAFVAPAALPAGSGVEKVWAAHLRAHVTATSYSSTTPGTLSLHRVTSSWSEGTGSCQGGPGDGDGARTGNVPSTDPVPSAADEVAAGAPSLLQWDVTDDVAAAGGPGALDGWRIVDSTSAFGDHYTHLASRERQSEAPRLFVLLTTAEAPTCIDVDPESTTAAAAGEAEVVAMVTDGERVVDAASGADGCSGDPVSTQLEWRIEHDEPDAYISRQNGAPIERVQTADGAIPDSLSAPTDTGGRASIHIRLSDPAIASGSSAVNRVSARIHGVPDVREKDDPDPTCGVRQTCPGEGHGEDDVEVRWTAGTPSPTSTATSGGSSSPSYVRPSRRPVSERSVTLTASGTTVVNADPVTLMGQVSSENPLCTGAGHEVTVRARRWGTEILRDLGVAATDRDGNFTFSFPAAAGTDLTVLVPGTAHCAEAVSAPVAVTVQVRVVAETSNAAPKPGARVRIAGSARPSHDEARVVLQRKTGSSWVTVAKASPKRGSQFSFALHASWAGARTFRVKCVPNDNDHAPGVSGPIRITVEDEE